VTSVSIDCLYSTDNFAITRWRCCETHADARHEKAQGANILSFPHEGSFRLRSRHGASLIGPNGVALFGRGEAYRTEHPCGCGDHGSAICLSEPMAAALLDEWRLAARGSSFPTGAAPIGPAVAAARARLLRDLRDLPLDGLEFDERVTRLLSLIGSPPGDPVPTQGAALDGVVAVCETLQRRYAEPIPLAELASILGLSVFHLCRLFKRVTGMTIGAYRASVRLQIACSRLLDDPHQDLSALALDLGFSSHSRFTAVFRREVGFTPSALRRR
jgi:AraC-like DNA-binding protein